MRNDMAVVCFFTNNVLVSISGAIPYQAVYGRMPPLMGEFEPASDLAIDDGDSGIPGVSRHRHRLREVAAQTTVDLTAKQRVERAARAKAHKVSEPMQLEAGDLVDFHRPPTTKDDSGWHGLASAVNVDGNAVCVRW